MPPKTAAQTRGELPAGEIRGKVARTYRVRTIAEIDANLRGLNEWLSDQLVKAPEFGPSFLYRFRADVNALLDARNQLMAEALIREATDL